MKSSWLIQVALAAQAASLSEAWVGVAVRTSLGVRVPGSRDVAPFFPLPVRIDRGRSGQRESGMRLTAPERYGAMPCSPGGSPGPSLTSASRKNAPTTWDSSRPTTAITTLTGNPSPCTRTSAPRPR
jgi:hypothetical protein